MKRHVQMMGERILRVVFGLVRWEEFSHGAETFCYFRWRQVSFAQEQMHAGLLRPDNVATEVFGEIESVIKKLADAPAVSSIQAPVALLFDYDADFVWAAQPHGAGLSYFGLVFDWYRSLRKLGLSIDILPATDRDFEGYQLIVVPGMIHMPADLKNALSNTSSEVILGLRTCA